MNANTITDLADPINPGDAMNLNAAQQAIASLPITWINGVQKTNVKQYFASAVVSGGLAVFSLTDDGTPTGNAVFTTEVYKESARFWIDDIIDQYQHGGYTLSADRKTLTMNVTRLGIVLLGIIQFVVSADGTTVYLSIHGD